MKKMPFIKQFNWRVMLVRIGLNGVTLLVVSLLPGIYFVEPTIGRILLLALVLGVLNAFVKPILQFLTLRFIFATYGFAIVIINTIILLLLSLLFPGMFLVGSLLWAIIGGVVMGLVAGFLENLLGLTMPILPEEDRPLREQLADPSAAIETVLVDRGAGQAEVFLADDEAPPALADAPSSAGAGEAARAAGDAPAAQRGEEP